MQSHITRIDWVLLNVDQLVQPLDDPCLRRPLALFLQGRLYHKDECLQGGRRVRDAAM